MASADLAPKMDLAGQQFGRLEVVTWAPTHSAHRHWLCQCACGRRTIVSSQHLRSGKTKSCGCLRSEPHAYKHGAKGTRLYSVWTHMKKRCHNANATNYCDYGGRGIYVCDEWRSGFLPFKAWALSHGYSDGLFIDRIDNDGPYAPWNCQFVDRTTNNRKRRNTFKIVVAGETMPLVVAAERFGISYDLLKYRIYAGYSGDEAVQPKVNPDEKTGTPRPGIVADQLRQSRRRSLRNRALREQKSEAARRAGQNR